MAAATCCRFESGVQPVAAEVIPSCGITYNREELLSYHGSQVLLPLTTLLCLTNFGILEKTNATDPLPVIFNQREMTQSGFRSRRTKTKKRRYNRPRRRKQKPNLTCRGHKKTYKSNVWLKRHVGKCPKIIDSRAVLLPRELSPVGTTSHTVRPGQPKQTDFLYMECRMLQLDNFAHVSRPEHLQCIDTHRDILRR